MIELQNPKRSITRIGYDDLSKRILSRCITPPMGLTIKELNNYLNGYAKCQNDILMIIEELKEGAE